MHLHHQPYTHFTVLPLQRDVNTKKYSYKLSMSPLYMGIHANVVHDAVNEYQSEADEQCSLINPRRACAARLR